MLARVLNVFLFAILLPLFAAAIPGGHPTVTVTVTAPASTQTIAASQCDTGALQCCNSVQKTGSGGINTILGLLGIVVGGIGIPVGLTCNPINVIGIGGNSCNSQPVCCQNNKFGGLVAIGCTPVNLAL